MNFGIEQGHIVVALDDGYPLRLHGDFATQQRVEVDPFEIIVRLRGKHR